MAENPSQALRDALVLLRAFVSSPWRSLDTASGVMRLSISRLTAADRAPLSLRSTASTMEKRGRLLTAPHVATLGEIAAVGETIHAGDIYAKIHVLDEVIDLRADENFYVASQESRLGDLLEFGSPLITAK